LNSAQLKTINDDYIPPVTDLTFITNNKLTPPKNYQIRDQHLSQTESKSK